MTAFSVRLPEDLMKEVDARAKLLHLPRSEYVRLAISEERDSEAAFGEAWQRYAAITPRFIPRRAKHEKSVIDHQGR